jgi:hypothetical protein
VWVIIIFGILGYIGYTYKRGSKGNRQQQAASYCPPPVSHADQQGDAGEQSVDAELRRILNRLCGTDFYLHRGARLIEHAPGTAFPTAEIDHLPVAPFGIFVVETKNWTGAISRGATLDTVVRTGSDGHAEQRKSPDAQNRTKVAFLRGMLPAIWPVLGVGVFSELEQWLRAKKAAFGADGRQPTDVRLAWEGLQKIVVADPAALSAHRAKLRENPSNNLVL